MTVNELIEYGYSLLATAAEWLARGFAFLFDPFSELSFAERIGEMTVGQFAFTLAICLLFILQIYRDIATEADGLWPRWVSWILAIVTVTLTLWLFWTHFLEF